MDRAWSLVRGLGEISQSALNLLFPPVCVGCGQVGARFCNDCAQAVEPLPTTICACCGRPQLVATPRCTNCRRDRDNPLTLIRAAALHTSPLREAIHALKYDHQPEVALLLARYLVAVYDAEPWCSLAARNSDAPDAKLDAALDAVVPVPLHPEREAERGYNQSALLATAFCATVGLPLQPTWLQRTRQTRQQVGLGRTARQENVAGAFAAQGDVAGRTLLLVDDVCTTGATLHACAAVARAAGALAVYGLTLAMPRPLWGQPNGLAQSLDNDTDDIDDRWWPEDV